MQDISQTNPIWRIAQWGAVVVLGIIVAGLFTRPDFTLALAWNVVVPILPASFLVTPAVWRAVCPLATLNVLTGSRGSGRKSLSKATVLRAGAIGIVLLIVLIPARHLVLNTNGLVLGTTLILLGIVALVTGLRYSTKAGFCNSICPILPVEKLYGQYPLLKVDNPRCPNCDLCTAKGCWDLGPTKSAIMPTRRPDRHWTMTAFGAFASAFPGVVLGYFLKEDGDPIVAVYAMTLGLGALSWIVFAGLSRAFKLTAEMLLPVLGAVAIAVYYYFAATSIAGTLGLGAATIVGIRVAMWALTVVWLWRALRLASPNGRHRSDIPSPQVS